MAEPYLTDRNKDDLARWLAANGENFEGYKKFAEARGWTVFTPAYLHVWVGRHRDAIRVHRGRYEAEIRSLTLMNKASRATALERSVRRIQDRIAAAESDEDDDRLIKLVEQERKLLQAISQERGEWMRNEEAEAAAPYAALIDNMMAAGRKALPPPTDEPLEFIEGEVAELEPAIG